MQQLDEHRAFPFYSILTLSVLSMSMSMSALVRNFLYFGLSLRCVYMYLDVCLNSEGMR